MENTLQRLHQQGLNSQAATGHTLPASLHSWAPPLFVPATHLLSCPARKTKATKANFLLLQKWQDHPPPRL